MAMLRRGKIHKRAKYLGEGAAVGHIKATFNNTKITVTDAKGNVYAWTSASKVGFRGARKSTPFAAQVAGSEIAKHCLDNLGIKRVHIRVQGPGSGRESAIRAIAAVLKVISIKDVTGIPHNGCRPPKKRRV